ncbi:MAG: DNA-3-methyladenine glycosylase I [Thermoplasmataceae archaeon]
MTKASKTNEENDGKIRCDWKNDDPLLRRYHDTEWGVAVHDDQRIFEFFVLEGMQAGLSWVTVLKKRDNFRKAFDHFSPEVVSRYGQDKIDSLLADAGIIRNRMKIEAAIINARAFIEVKLTFRMNQEAYPGINLYRPHYLFSCFPEHF